MVFADDGSYGVKEGAELVKMRPQTTRGADPQAHSGQKGPIQWGQPGLATQAVSSRRSKFGIRG